MIFITRMKLFATRGDRDFCFDRKVKIRIPLKINLFSSGEFVLFSEIQLPKPLMHRRSSQPRRFRRNTRQSLSINSTIHHISPPSEKFSKKRAKYKIKSTLKIKRIDSDCLSSSQHWRQKSRKIKGV